MYAVVGCNECRALWVVADDPETTGCPRCGKRHQFGNLRRFAETEDEDAAREARAALLAKRQNASEAFADLEDFATMGEQVEGAGVDEETYLSASGLDADAVAEAGDRAASGTTGGASRRETVLAAVEELDAPTEANVVDYAAERGVPAEWTRNLLARLVRAGEATEADGEYRRL